MVQYTTGREERKRQVSGTNSRARRRGSCRDRCVLIDQSDSLNTTDACTEHLLSVAARVFLALLGAAAGAIAFFVAAIALSVLTDTCDPKVHVCDIAMIGGVGLGLLVAPIGAMIAGIMVWRWTR
jgi:hypothetical protein